MGWWIFGKSKCCEELEKEIKDLKEHVEIVDNATDHNLRRIDDLETSDGILKKEIAILSQSFITVASSVDKLADGLAAVDKRIDKYHGTKRLASAGKKQ